MENKVDINLIINILISRKKLYQEYQKQDALEYAENNNEIVRESIVNRCSRRDARINEIDQIIEILSK